MSQTLYKAKATLSELPKVAKDILNILPNNAIIFLKGDLAAGKTTLTNQIAKILNLSLVTSPTFSLQQIYEDKLFHYDFYRIDFDKILELGLIDEFEKEGLHFIEWGSFELQELLKKAGFNIFELQIDNLGNKREYLLKALDA